MPLSITPKTDEIDSSGGSGTVFVRAPMDFAWSVANVPAWIEVARSGGIGDAVLQYRVAENRSNLLRSAAIAIGGATLRLTQPRGPHVSLPYFEKFAPDSTTGDSVTWALNNQSGQNAALRISPEAPAGSNSLVLEKARADPQPWMTQVYLPGIETKAGAPYHLTLWVKAQAPALIGLKLIHRTAPYDTCGLAESVWAPADWTQIDLRFRTTVGCGADANRLSIDAGAISGRLWISQIALTEDPP